MPLLPRKNTLDYNPNSIIDASKKITAIALERMKNPILDPDQATLTTMKSSASLNDSLATLEGLAGSFHSTLLRIQNLSGTAVRGSGRKPGSKNKPKETAKKSSSSSSAAAAEASKEETDKLVASMTQADFDRWKPFYQDDDRNSEAKGTSQPGFLDDDSLPSIPNYRSGGDGDSSFDGSVVGNIPFNIGKESDVSWTSLIFNLIQLTRQMDILVVSRIRPVISSLSPPQISKLNDIYIMVFNSYNDLVRPFGRRIIDARTRQLTGDQYKDPFSKVLLNPNSNVFQQYGVGDTTKAIIESNEYGDEILNTFNTERQKLCLDLMVVINSWRQNTPTGQQMEFGDNIQRDFNSTLKKNKDLMMEVEGERGEGFGVAEDVSPDVPEGAGRSRKGRPRKTGQMTLVGNGRNFYGEKINESRDLPCLLSSIRNCPTKYLL